MTGLNDKWSKQPKTGIADKINDTIKPKGPLKPRVQDGIKKLQSQIKKLDSMLSSLKAVSYTHLTLPTTPYV